MQDLVPGYIVTNAHVIGQARRGTATFHHGPQAGFDVVGTDPLSDLAVVRTRGETPEPAQLGDADQLRVGQLVAAIATQWA